MDQSGATHDQVYIGARTGRLSRLRMWICYMYRTTDVRERLKLHFVTFRRPGVHFCGGPRCWRKRVLLGHLCLCAIHHLYCTSSAMPEHLPNSFNA